MACCDEGGPAKGVLHARGVPWRCLGAEAEGDEEGDEWVEEGAIEDVEEEVQR